MVSNNDHTPMVRQLIVDNNKKTYLLHASGTEKRKDVNTNDPTIYGVLAFVLKPVHYK